MDRILASIDENRRAALEEASRPTRGHDDGSHVETFEGDETGRVLAAERVIAGMSQIAKHRQMAEAGHAYTHPQDQFKADLARRERAKK